MKVERIDCRCGLAGSEGRLRREEDREGFKFFCDLDPVFQMRIGEDSMIAVSATPSPESVMFTLAEYAEDGIDGGAGSGLARWSRRG
ncbi:hypothetical protein [Micromonospora sp. DT227]|uniref:hypothetical protein n=1 Tax=Micromonospora sp. DT227 TaxID=3393433 RepID=UPI003CEAFF4A